MRGRRGALPAVALALALSACSGADAADEGGTVVTVSPSAGSPAPTTPAAPALDAGAALNERGNIVKQVGEPAGIGRSADPGSPTVLTFTVEDLVINPECTSGFEQAPLTGNYLGIYLRVETTPDYDPKQLRTFSEYDFALLGPDGTPIPQVLENAQVCFGADDEMSARRLGPGEQYEGWVVLDMPVRAGTLIYQPAGEPNGWEWEF
jgi:hypothetical protein